LTHIERKAIKSWRDELKIQNSAITDLMVGQQMNTVTCLTCAKKTYQFENFYNLGLPLPYNSKCIFYINVIKRSGDQITPIIKYGIQLEKTNKLGDLLNEIEKSSNIRRQNMFLVEIRNSKFFAEH
jgi:hypothetical protein